MATLKADLIAGRKALAPNTSYQTVRQTLEQLIEPQPTVATEAPK
jgi:hypothetical protein